MKSKIPFFITATLQLIYLFCILLNFLCIWMFTTGVPYTYPLAVLGYILLFFCPVELFCLVPNIIFLVKGIKAHTRRQNIVRIVYICTFFVALVLIKIVLRYCGNAVLVGVA